MLFVVTPKARNEVLSRQEIQETLLDLIVGQRHPDVPCISKHIDAYFVMTPCWVVLFEEAAHKDSFSLDWCTSTCLFYARLASKNLDLRPPNCIPKSRNVHLIRRSVSELTHSAICIFLRTGL